MSENTRKMLSFLVAAAILFSMLPVGVSAQAQSVEQNAAVETAKPDTTPELDELEPVTSTVPGTTLDAPMSFGTLALGENVVTVAEAGVYANYTFTPMESGVYEFYSVSDQDTKASLFSKQGYSLTSDDDSGDGNNFFIVYELTAGETYTLNFGFYQFITGNIKVVVQKTPLVGYSFAPVSVIEGTLGYWVYADNKYYQYSEYEIVQHSTITATFADGTVVTDTGRFFEYEGRSYEVSSCWSWSGDQVAANPWTVGNTYTIHTSLANITADFEATIIPSPLKSISFTPINVTEGTNGYLMEDWESVTQPGKEYFHYNVYDLMYKTTYTAMLHDGTVLTGTGGALQYNGTFYEMSLIARQSADAPWTVGNTYSLTASIMGQTVDIPVTIEEYPLVSLTFTPVTTIENCDGEQRTDSDGTYFCYNAYTLLRKSTYTATFSDGTVLTGNNDYFYYNGQYCPFFYSTEQSASNPWTVGNTYSITVSVMGQTVQIPVTINPSPLESITFEPITVFEGTCGSVVNEKDPVTGQNVSYFRYQDWEIMGNTQYTATFADGSVQRENGGSGIYYDGTYYSPTFSSNQEWNAPWTVGNTYYINVSILSKTVEVPVTIVPSPVVSFTVEPVYMIENTGGSENTYWPGDGNAYTYYAYHWSNRLHYTVTLNDGSVFTGTNGGGFYYKDNWYPIYSEDGQGWEDQWTVGNTYTGKASVMGYTVDVPVTIQESPVASVTVEPILFREHSNGYWAGDAYGQYYRYEWEYEMRYTITFKDGTVRSGEYWDRIEYDGEYYGVDSTKGRPGGANPWLSGNTYVAQAKIGGKWCDVYVSIYQNVQTNGYTYFVQDGKVIINDCTLQNEILEIPETIDGYPVVGINALGSSLEYAREIHIPDSVTLLSANFLKLYVYYGGPELPLEKLVLGSGVASLSVMMMERARNLKEIQVAADNPYICSIDGVVYNKDVTVLLAYPPAKTELHVIPDSVVDVGVLFNLSNEYSDLYNNINFQFGAGVKGYKMVDGILYNEDMTKVVKATGSATGSYVMPDSVTDIQHLAFAGSKLTAITIGAGVTNIAYGAFYGAINLEEITIPNNVEVIEGGGFFSCTSLNKVKIFDLSAWCRIDFWENPLAYAHNLYLNGELIVDLVIPADVTGNPYASSKISKIAFIGGSFKTVTIPSRIEYIAEDTFLNCENLEKVFITDLAAWARTRFDSKAANPLYYARDLYLNNQKIVDLVLPKTVVNNAYGVRGVYGVGAYAFCNINIETLTVPNYVYDIGDFAFWNSAVESITFEEGDLDAIGRSAFRSSNVKSLDLPDSLRYIGSAAFCECDDLQTVTFGNGLQEIDYQAFYSSGVKSAVFPDSLTYLGGSAFAYCEQLTHVDFGNTLSAIPNSGFCCTGLKTVTLPKQITLVDNYAFANSKLTEVIFNCDSVTIWDAAFKNCPLGDLVLGSNVIVAGRETFYGISSTQIKLLNGVTQITYREFAYCENLVSVTIPETIKEIETYAFEGDENLSHVLYTGTQAQWDALGVDSVELLNATLHCEATGDEVTTTQTCRDVTYHCAICGEKKTVIKGQPAHVYDENGECTICGVGDWDFTVDENTGELTIIRYLGKDTDLIIPDTIKGKPVTAIAPGLFANNRQIRSVVLPDSITEIPEEAFAGCSQLRTITMGANLTVIGDWAFGNCYWLQNVNLPDSLTTIGAFAFEGCSIGEITLPKKLTNIGVGAFASSGIQGKLEIPEGVTEIAYYAFEFNDIEEVTIPSTVKKINGYAFSDNYNLRAVGFRGDQPEMDDAFDNNGISMYYPASNKTWKNLPQDGNIWYACDMPVITQQLSTYAVNMGELVPMYLEVEGCELHYQWYFAAPGSKKFELLDEESNLLPVVVDESTCQGRVYCLVTDILGNTVKSDVVTIRTHSESTGIRISQLPYTLEYSMHQALRTRGLKVVMTYADGNEEVLDYFEISGYNPSVCGEQTVTITYGDYTATFTVTVNEEKVNFTNTQEQIEINAPQGAVDSNVELVVDKVEQEEEIPELPEIIQENNAVIFDITLEKEGQAVQPAETVQVSIPVPQHMRSKRCKVYHIGDDGVATDMNAWYQDGRMVFDTDHFSYYAVVEVDGVTVSGTLTGAEDFTGAEVKLISRGEVLETVVVSPNGTYRFENVVANDYRIEAVQDGLPSKTVDMTVADQDIILDILLAILGDIDGNELVTRDDVINLLLHVTMPNRFPLNAEADFDGDGRVTRDDVIRLLLHVTMPNRFPLAN